MMFRPQKDRLKDKAMRDRHIKGRLYSRGYNDGYGAWTHDFWQFVKYKKSRAFDKFGIQDIFMYRYPAHGFTFLEDVRLDPIWNHWKFWNIIRSLSIDDGNSVSLEEIEKLISQILEFNIEREHATLYLSGGPDSAYLYCLCKTKNISIEPATIRIPEMGIDDVEPAKKITEYYGDELKVHTISLESILNDLPEIVKMLGLPYDRGSALVTYYQIALGGDDIVVGDSGDLIFAPSFASHTDAMNGKYGMVKLEDQEFENLFGKPATTRRKWFPLVNNLEGALAFDVLSEVPYYYRNKIDALRQITAGDKHVHGEEPVNVLAPYMDKYLFLASLRNPALHVHSYYKEPLQKLISKHMPTNLVQQKKVPLKIHPHPAIFSTFYKPEYFTELHFFNHDLDPNTCTPWTRYLLALTSIWFDHYTKAIEFRRYDEFTEQ